MCEENSYEQSEVQSRLISVEANEILHAIQCQIWRSNVR